MNSLPGAASLNTGRDGALNLQRLSQPSALAALLQQQHQQQQQQPLTQLPPQLNVMQRYQLLDAQRVRDTSSLTSQLQVQRMLDTARQQEGRNALLRQLGISNATQVPNVAALLAQTADQSHVAQSTASPAAILASALAREIQPATISHLARQAVPSNRAQALGAPSSQGQMQSVDTMILLQEIARLRQENQRLQQMRYNNNNAEPMRLAGGEARIATAAIDRSLLPESPGDTQTGLLPQGRTSTVDSKRQLPQSAEPAGKRQKISFEEDIPNDSIQNGFSLGLKTDQKHLSNYQILMRKCFEFFPASREDVETKVQGRRKTVEIGQVGIRCRFCADIDLKFRGKAAVYYPQKLSGVYQAAQNMTVTHLIQHCMSIDSETRKELDKQRQIRDYVGGGKKYWVRDPVFVVFNPFSRKIPTQIDACLHAGLVERENGIWFEAKGPDSKLAAK